MKLLLEEIAGDNAISGVQVNDPSGIPVLKRFDESFESDRCERLGGLLSELESSTEQTLFNPEGFEMEFDNLQLLVAKAHTFTIAMIADSEAKSDVVRAYLNRIQEQIESQPESEWRLEADDALAESVTPEEAEAAPKEAAAETPIVASTAVEDALSIVEDSGNDESDDEDLLETLDIDPKQKAIIRIQQKALVDAKKTLAGGSPKEARRLEGASTRYPIEGRCIK